MRLFAPSLIERGSGLKPCFEAQKKPLCSGFFIGPWPGSTLARFETRVALADHEHFAATAHNLAVTVPLLGGLQRGKHLHGRLLERNESK